jgi:hypothetical protein
MEKIVLIEEKKINFNGIDKCFFNDNGNIGSFTAYQSERVEPKLVLNLVDNPQRGIVAEAQYKWSANCSHLLYDVLADHLIIRKITGSNKLIHSVTDLSRQILSYLGSAYYPSNVTIENKLDDVSEGASYLENPTRFDGYKHSFISDLIKESLSGLAIKDENYPENIIIYRRIKNNLKRNRNINNVKMLQAELDRRIGKFVLVDMEDYTLNGQIKIFKNAKRIISVHGSALVWLNFCDQGTKCIEIITPIFRNNDFIKSDFWVMSQQAGVIHKSYYTDKIIGEDIYAPHEIDIDIDINHIVELLLD